MLTCLLEILLKLDEAQSKDLKWFAMIKHLNLGGYALIQ